MGDLDRPAGERWVTMSNALTRAGHGLTLAEKRIVASAVSKLDSRRALPPGEVPRTRITAAEYAETFEVDLNTAYEQLQSAAKQLYKPLDHVLRTRAQAQRQAAAADAGANALGGVGEVPGRRGLGRTGVVAGSAAPPPACAASSPATNPAGQRPALGLFLEAPRTADALRVHRLGRGHHRGLQSLDGRATEPQ